MEAIVVFNTADSPTRLTLDYPKEEATTFTQAWPLPGGHLITTDHGKLDVTVAAREMLLLTG